MKRELVGGVTCRNVGPVQIGACARLPSATEAFEGAFKPPQKPLNSHCGIKRCLQIKGGRFL